MTAKRHLTLSVASGKLAGSGKMVLLLALPLAQALASIRGKG